MLLLGLGVASGIEMDMVVLFALKPRRPETRSRLSNMPKCCPPWQVLDSSSSAPIHAGSVGERADASSLPPT